MRHLLFLSHRIPYPPDKGDKIRSFHVLRHLSRRFRLHLGAFVDDPRDWRRAGELDALCESRCLVPLRRLPALARGAGGMLAGRALTMGYFSSGRMRTWVREVCGKFPISAAFVFSSSMAPYAAALEGMEKVVDYCDLDSVKWRQYGERSSGLKRCLLMREAQNLARAERQLARRYRACLFISEREAALFEGGTARVEVMRNGVDADYFDPALGSDSPYAAGERPVTFVGAMDYAPNVEGVAWFCANVLPGLQASDPAVRFYIVGSNPTPQVLALARLPGVVVTGRVEDVRPYVRHATCIVAPLQIARGVQNKVLEALAMGQRIVGTPEAFEGIDPPLGEFAWSASTAQEFAACVRPLIAGGPSQPYSAGAREFVLREFRWETNLQLLDRLLS